jgi:hypothetical protein
MASPTAADAWAEDYGIPIDTLEDQLLVLVVLVLVVVLVLAIAGQLQTLNTAGGVALKMLWSIIIIFFSH